MSLYKICELFYKKAINMDALRNLSGDELHILLCGKHEDAKDIINKIKPNTKRYSEYDLMYETALQSPNIKTETILYLIKDERSMISKTESRLEALLKNPAVQLELLGNPGLFNEASQSLKITASYIINDDNFYMLGKALEDDKRIEALNYRNLSEKNKNILKEDLRDSLKHYILDKFSLNQKHPLINKPYSSFNSEYIDKAYDILVSLCTNKLNEYKNNLDKYIDECLSKDHIDSILTIKENLIRKFDVRGLEKEFEEAIQPIFIIPKDGWLRTKDYFDHNKYEKIIKDFEYSIGHPSV